MKKKMLLLLLPFLCFLPFTLNAEEGHNMLSNDAKKGMVMEEKIVKDVKLFFHVMTKAEHERMMKNSGHVMETHDDGASSHHLMLSMYDALEKKMVGNVPVKVEIITPKGKKRSKKLMAMMGHYGVNITLGEKGKYAFVILTEVGKRSISAPFAYMND